MNQDEQQAVSVLLNRLANELIQRFGTNPVVPQDELMPIAAEVFVASEYSNSPTILAGLNHLIDVAYGKASTPSA